ncbi:hypothetical protein D915_005228 [Fasciola hepatica]|uniref:Uncharacterized protein n=1 Tax=Fasciola hepatica TaxID=6192 RepID=A0A4E0R7H6_FASHE|nr:hypothetical protein D915_005228 [Fasciola hepatica]
MKVLLLICVFELVVAQIAAADSPTEKIERNQTSTEIGQAILQQEQLQKNSRKKKTNTTTTQTPDQNSTTTASITNTAVTPTATLSATRCGFVILVLLTTMIIQQIF